MHVTLLTKLLASSCLDVYVALGGSSSGLLVNVSVQQQLLHSHLVVYGELPQANQIGLVKLDVIVSLSTNIFTVCVTYMLFLMIEYE